MTWATVERAPARFSAAFAPCHRRPARRRAVVVLECHLHPARWDYLSCSGASTSGQRESATAIGQLPGLFRPGRSTSPLSVLRCYQPIALAGDGRARTSLLRRARCLPRSSVFVIWWGFLTGQQAPVKQHQRASAHRRYRLRSAVLHSRSGRHLASSTWQNPAKDLALFTVFPPLGIVLAGHALSARDAADPAMGFLAPATVPVMVGRDGRARGTDRRPLCQCRRNRTDSAQTLVGMGVEKYHPLDDRLQLYLTLPWLRLLTWVLPHMDHDRPSPARALWPESCFALPPTKPVAA